MVSAFSFGGDILFIVLTALIYVAVCFFVWCLCKVASRADEFELKYKSKEE